MGQDHDVSSLDAVTDIKQSKIKRIHLKKGHLNKNEMLTFYLLVLPWIIGFLLFTFGPMLYSLYTSFTKWDMISPPEFNGIYNYKYMFNVDPLFWKSLKITLIYAFTSVPLGLVTALILAVLMNQNVPGIGIFRTVYYLPSVVSGVAIAMLWVFLFNRDFGLVNAVLEKIGVKGLGWFMDPKTALATLVLISLYGVGSTAIIFLAGLKNIPASYYESAEIDGSNRLHSFVFITLPLLTPTVLFNLLMNLINGFQVFTEGLIITNGGPDNSTLFYNLYLYQNAFSYSSMGYASSLAWILFLITFVISIIILKFSNKWVYYEGDEK